MNKSSLAIHVGEKIIKTPLPIYNSIGSEEIKAVEEVLKSGVLSKYLGCWHDDFYGGPKVQQFKQVNIKFRRSLYFVKDIKKGQVISVEHVKSIRLGFGLLPKYYDQILGRVEKCYMKRGLPVTKLVIT